MKVLGPILALIWAVLTATAAGAGAWPRETGGFFLSATTDARRDQIYAEYGLGGDWTIGTELSMPGQGKSRRPDLLVFLHHPLWRGEGGAILSGGIGAESRAAPAQMDPQARRGRQQSGLRAGLFWGKGIATQWGDGWASVDLQFVRGVTRDWRREGVATKLDATFGLKPTDKVILMTQLQAWRRGGRTEARMEPSFGYRLGQATLVLSPSFGVIGPRDGRVKLGMWLEF